MICLCDFSLCERLSASFNFCRLSACLNCAVWTLLYFALLSLFRLIKVHLISHLVVLHFFQAWTLASPERGQNFVDFVDFVDRERRDTLELTNQTHTHTHCDNNAYAVKIMYALDGLRFHCHLRESARLSHQAIWYVSTKKTVQKSKSKSIVAYRARCYP